jgi:hypothetical protein
MAIATPKEQNGVAETTPVAQKPSYNAKKKKKKKV